MARELTREEKRAIHKLVKSLCANYDKDYGCPVCGRAFLPDGRTRYCSEACAGAARRKKQRGYMRKYRG